MLYLPSFRRSAHQAGTPPPAFTFRPYTPDPIPSPAPIHNLDSNHSTNAIPNDNGTTFISPYSSPHLTPAAPKPQQTTLTRVAQNAHYALLALSLFTVAIAITVVGLAAATLHQYHHARSGPHHLQRLPTNLDTAPTTAVLGSGALVAVLNVTFVVVAILQVTRHQSPNTTTSTITPLLTLLTTLTTFPFTLFALTYYHLHAYTLPPSITTSSSSSSSTSYGPALSARGVAPAPIPTSTASTHPPSSALSSPGATSVAAVAGLQGYACRFATGNGMAGGICREGRAMGVLVAVLVGVCVLGAVGGGVGVWVGRRRGRMVGGRGRGDEGKRRERDREEGGWL